MGGYGRGELHPYSDIDLLILLDENDQEIFREPIEGFLTSSGTSARGRRAVRSVAECADEARADLTVITNLMESRTIAGPERLRQAMLQVTSTQQMWPSKEFFLLSATSSALAMPSTTTPSTTWSPTSRVPRRSARHPDHPLDRASRVRHPQPAGHGRPGFITEGEHSLLTAAQEFLWKVRYGLHMLAGRAEDRLLFDHQRSLAALLGYEDSDAKLAIERFMQKYYRVVMSIAELSDLVGQHFAEVILWEGESGPIVPLNSRFRT